MQVGTFIDKWGGRFSNLATAWQILIPAGVVAMISGYLARSVAWLNQFGAFGWWAAALVGFLFTCLAAAGISSARLWWMHGSNIRKWRQDVVAVNPVDNEFTKRRINIMDLVNPVTKRIKNKRFIDCEIIGPATLVMTGSGSFSDVAFENVDFVPCKGNAMLYNIVALDNCQFIGGSISMTTIFLPGESYKYLEALVQSFPTLTGNAEIDSR